MSFHSRKTRVRLGLRNAPFNQGKSKLFEGVAGNLVAFACQLSFQRGYEISFQNQAD